MTNETRRRQKRQELMAKARQMQEADRRRRIEIIKRIIDIRNNSTRPYNPETGKAQLRDLFGILLCELFRDPVIPVNIKLKFPAALKAPVLLQHLQDLLAVPLIGLIAVIFYRAALLHMLQDGCF